MTTETERLKVGNMDNSKRGPIDNPANGRPVTVGALAVAAAWLAGRLRPEFGGGDFVGDVAGLLDEIEELAACESVSFGPREPIAVESAERPAGGGTPWALALEQIRLAGVRLESTDGREGYHDLWQALERARRVAEPLPPLTPLQMLTGSNAWETAINEITAAHRRLAETDGAASTHCDLERAIDRARKMACPPWLGDPLHRGQGEGERIDWRDYVSRVRQSILDIRTAFSGATRNGIAVEGSLGLADGPPGLVFLVPEPEELNRTAGAIERALEAVASTPAGHKKPAPAAGGGR